VTGTDLLADDPRFATAGDRASNASELAFSLASIFASRTAAEWERVLVPYDVACVEVNQGPFSEFTINDATMVDNGFTVEVEHPMFGRHRRHGPIVTMSETPGVAGPGCLVGQHTRRILDELGYTDEQMTDLRQRGIVGWPDEPAN
jgi:crotonobetainyl-CoA:carnitine CoA-transferase CaiB-like acyl-CoA transferase